MALILSIETSTNICSVAIHKDGSLMSHIESNVPNSHSEILNNCIAEIINTAGHDISDMDAICIAKGPGSYTGLRIGSSTAKGLCYALDIPLLAIDTLYGMMLNVLDKVDAKFIVPMIDARRDEVYTAIYDSRGEVVVSPHAKILTEESYIETIGKENTLFFGNGAMKFSLMVDRDNMNFDDTILPNARGFGKVALEKYEKNDFEDLAYFEPYYLKEFYTKPAKKISLTKNA